MSKELWIKAHEELIEEYLEQFPDAEWADAYENTADAAQERAREKYAALVDEAKDRAKYGR